jgi:hypothetical protein
VVGATRELGSSANAGPVDAASETVSQGIYPVDAPLITRATDYRAATTDDLDPIAMGWLRQSGDVQAGRIAGDYSGNNSPRDVAYMLVKNDGSRRVVLLANGENAFDSLYKSFGFIARVPKARIAPAPWTAKPDDIPDGDGLLIVRDTQNPASGQIVFLSSGKLVSGNLKDFQQVSLE